MKKVWQVLGLVVAFVALSCVPSHCQAVLLQNTSAFSGTGVGPDINLYGTTVDVHKLYWRHNGTVTTCQIGLDGSQDGTTWNANAVIGAQTCTSDGEIYVGTNSVPHVRINLSTFSGGGTLSVTYAGTSYVYTSVVGTVTTSITGTPSVSITGTPTFNVGTGAYAAPTANPCTNPAIVQQSVPIAITTATTTQLVPGVGGQKVYPCGFTIAMTGTVLADTIQFVHGTGATCTSPTTLTGAMSSGILTAGATTLTAPFGLKPSAVGESTCAITTVGTLPTIEGVFSYVQQ